MKKLAVIHTTPVTVETFKTLAAEALPGYEVVNFVDDSILPQLRENGGDVTQVEDRLLHYARFAEQVGADVILSACSSVGEVAAKMRQQVSVPVVRVDDAMAEEAIQRGQRVGVVATLGTTLAPTLALLRSKAEASGRDVTFEARVVDSAYQKLIAGDRDGHDAILAAALEEMAKTNDVIVLAQASMARVLPNLPERIQGKFLTSPRLAMGQVKTALGLV